MLRTVILIIMYFRHKLTDMPLDIFVFLDSLFYYLLLAEYISRIFQGSDDMKTNCKR
jgi:hypothetical protein